MFNIQFLFKENMKNILLVYGIYDAFSCFARHAEACLSHALLNSQFLTLNSQLILRTPSY